MLTIRISMEAYSSCFGDILCCMETNSVNISKAKKAIKTGKPSANDKSECKEKSSEKGEDSSREKKIDKGGYKEKRNEKAEESSREKKMDTEESMTLDDTMSVSIVDEENEEAEELLYLGDARYGIKINGTTLIRVQKIPKTPEKFILNLLEHILSEEEITHCTLYGNKQHGKKSLDEMKRKAMRSALYDKFGEGKTKEELQEMWQNLTVKINDKIRGIRNGKYNKQN